MPRPSPSPRWRACTCPCRRPTAATSRRFWSDDVTPTELMVMDARPGRSRAPRHHLAAPRSSRATPWVRPRYATFTNAVDGFVVHARILEPAGARPHARHPVIFGPVYSNTVRNRWNGLAGTLQQFLVQQGYIVVQVDVRGSVGYGRAFREAFLMDYGGKDLDDLQAVVDGLKALPYVDGSAHRHLGQQLRRPALGLCAAEAARALRGRRGRRAGRGPARVRTGRCGDHADAGVAPRGLRARLGAAPRRRTCAIRC